MNARDYWNSNLDSDNLSRAGGDAPHSLDDALAFADTPEFQWLRKRVGDVRDRRVIDVGGGVGMHALLWARAGARVVVMDPAVERLRSMKRLARRAGLEGRIACVAGAAEGMPLRGESADVIFTKSVLIHTNLERAAVEIHRVLAAGGHGVFIEPLNRNPLIRLYRRWFAPGIWRDITRYFDANSIATLRKPFGRLRWKPFYLCATAAFVLQYGVRHRGLFQRCLRALQKLDHSLLKRLPGLEGWCWFAAIETRKQPKDPA